MKITIKCLAIIAAAAVLPLMPPALAQPVREEFVIHVTPSNLDEAITHPEADSYNLVFTCGLFDSLASALLMKPTCEAAKANFSNVAGLAKEGLLGPTLAKSKFYVMDATPENIAGLHSRCGGLMESEVCNTANAGPMITALNSRDPRKGDLDARPGIPELAQKIYTFVKSASRH